MMGLDPTAWPTDSSDRVACPRTSLRLSVCPTSSPGTCTGDTPPRLAPLGRDTVMPSLLMDNRVPTRVRQQPGAGAPSKAGTTRATWPVVGVVGGTLRGKGPVRMVQVGSPGFSTTRAETRGCRKALSGSLASASPHAIGREVAL
jgi:hypothetical protein